MIKETVTVVVTVKEIAMENTPEVSNGNVTIVVSQDIRLETAQKRRSLAIWMTSTI